MLSKKIAFRVTWPKALVCMSGHVSWKVTGSSIPLCTISMFVRLPQYFPQRLGALGPGTTFARNCYSVLGFSLDFLPLVIYRNETVIPMSDGHSSQTSQWSYFKPFIRRCSACEPMYIHKNTPHSYQSGCVRTPHNYSSARIACSEYLEV